MARHLIFLIYFWHTGRDIVTNLTVISSHTLECFVSIADCEKVKTCIRVAVPKLCQTEHDVIGSSGRGISMANADQR